MKAICVRCGQSRSQWDKICPHCGHRPEGEGLLVAWLLSSENLEEAQLQQVSQRVKDGEVIRPKPAHLKKAREALGQAWTSDPGLTVPQRLGILAASILATPLVGLTCWIWWRQVRPRASIQSLALSLPASILFTVLWPALYLWGVLSVVPG